MSLTRPVSKPASDTAIRTYELFCLAALLVMLLVLVDGGLGLWSALPVLVGLGGIAGRWQTAVPILIFALGFVLVGFWLLADAYRIPELEWLGEFLLCGAVLGYAAGQYRLQGLAGQLIPKDPRVPAPRWAVGNLATRSTRALGEMEIVLLVICLPPCVLLATWTWSMLPDDLSALGLPPPVWRLVIFIWLLSLGTMAARLLLGSLAWDRRGRTRQEAVMFLQDTLWRETRREQRRLHRWLAWGRLRADRRKELP
jgi:hypothetical protein